MSVIMRHAWSSVGRKVLMALTGLGLVVFVVFHLLGNLTLLMGRDAFNGYAYFLEHLAHGVFIYVAEAGLLLFFLLHAVSGVKVWLQARQARGTDYEVVADAGGASRKTWASRTMIVTGPVLLVFLVLHVLHFKFGDGVAEGYAAPLHGAEVRDLYGLVVREFNKFPVVFAYVVVMVLLGFHLRHGFWSACQSLGLANPRTLPALVAVSAVLGVVLAIGFIYIPVHIYAFVEDTRAAVGSAGPPAGGGH